MTQSSQDLQNADASADLANADYSRPKLAVTIIARTDRLCKLAWREELWQPETDAEPSEGTG